MCRSSFSAGALESRGFADLCQQFLVSKTEARLLTRPLFLAFPAKKWQNKRHVFASIRGVMAKSYKAKFTDSA